MINTYYALIQSSMRNIFYTLTLCLFTLIFIESNVVFLLSDQPEFKMLLIDRDFTIIFSFVKRLMLILPVYLRY